MRTAMLCFLVAITASWACGDEKKEEQPGIPQEKWNIEFAEKMWGMKLQSVSYDPKSQQFTLIMAYTKDLSKEELKPFVAAFPPLDSAKGAEGRSKVVAFYFIGKDNVILAKHSFFWTDSEPTGVKGDAVKLQMTRPTDNAKVAKVELRPLK